MTESDNKPNCWHLLRLEQNPIIDKMVEIKTLECLTGYFCDHRIPKTSSEIGKYMKIDCDHQENISECPIIIREKRA